MSRILGKSRTHFKKILAISIALIGGVLFMLQKSDSINQNQDDGASNIIFLDSDRAFADVPFSSGDSSSGDGSGDGGGDGCGDGGCSG